MCRLFGFRSIIRSQVHRSLVAADNALGQQSERHPDGWGVAFYVDDSPHVTRMPLTALEDHLFHRLSGVVSSETVIAHVRKATQGNNSVLNCHPFQFGKWTFAHNGDIPDFSSKRDRLVAEIAPRLRRFILGDTDSEVVFFLLMSQLQRYGPLRNPHQVQDVIAAVRDTIRQVRAVCDDGDGDPCLLTFLASDGKTLVATQGGKELYWSTYKTRCADRDECPHLATECEAPSQTGFINHLLFSSEIIAGDNVWTALEPGDIVGVDWRMRLTRAHVDRTVLPLAAAEAAS